MTTASPQPALPPGGRIRPDHQATGPACHLTHRPPRSRPGPAQPPLPCAVVPAGPGDARELANRCRAHPVPARSASPSRWHLAGARPPHRAAAHHLHAPVHAPVPGRPPRFEMVRPCGRHVGCEPESPSFATARSAIEAVATGRWSLGSLMSLRAGLPLRVVWTAAGHPLMKHGPSIK